MCIITPYQFDEKMKIIWKQREKLQRNTDEFEEFIFELIMFHFMSIYYKLNICKKKKEKAKFTLRRGKK